MFKTHVDKNKSAAFKEKILRHIQLGENKKAQELQAKYHKWMIQQPHNLKIEFDNLDLTRRILVARFLRLVAQGLQDEAQALLEQNITLLLESGVAISTAGRRFDSVTAYQYSQWSLDAHASAILIKLIPKNSKGDEIRDALREQRNRRLEQGLTYDFCRAKIILTRPTEIDIKSIIERKEYLFTQKGTQIEIGYCDTKNKYQTIKMDTEDKKKNPKIVEIMMGYKKPNNILNTANLSFVEAKPEPVTVSTQAAGLQLILPNGIRIGITKDGGYN